MLWRSLLSFASEGFPWRYSDATKNAMREKGSLCAHLVAAFDLCCLDFASAPHRSIGGCPAVARIFCRNFASAVAPIICAVPEAQRPSTRCDFDG